MTTLANLDPDHQISHGIQRQAFLPTQRTWLSGRTEPPAPYQPTQADAPRADLSRSAQIWLLLRRLLELRDTPPNERWIDANWPTQEAFIDASEFIRRLPEKLKALPHIALADDGEVNFAWNHHNTRIDLGFYGTGFYSYYAKAPYGQEFFGDHIAARGPIPQNLSILITG